MRTPEQNRIYQHTWYLKNKKKQMERNDAKRIRNMEFVSSIKTKCSICGEDHPACLEFHHTESTKKEKSVSRLVQEGYGIERIKKEIAKCIVVCANCHKKIHYKMP